MWGRLLCALGRHKRGIYMRHEGPGTRFYAACARCNTPLKPPSLAELMDKEMR